MKQFTKRNGEGAVCVTADTPSPHCKGKHLYNDHDTTEEQQIQQIKEIMEVASKGCKVSHIRLSQLAIQHSPKLIRENAPCLFGSVLYVGYVLGVRAEREKRRK